MENDTDMFNHINSTRKHIPEASSTACVGYNPCNYPGMKMAASRACKAGGLVVKALSYESEVFGACLLAAEILFQGVIILSQKLRTLSQRLKGMLPNSLGNSGHKMYLLVNWVIGTPNCL